MTMLLTPTNELSCSLLFVPMVVFFISLLEYFPHYIEIISLNAFYLFVSAIQFCSHQSHEAT